MKSVIRIFGSELPEFYFPLRSDGEIDVCPVDAFAGQTFNLNEFGHIQSDVSALMQAQSQSEKDLIAQRLVEAQGENPDLSGLTDSDIFKYSMSRYYQTPSEVAQYAESLAKAQNARAERLQKEAASKAASEVAAKKAAERAANIEKLISEGKLSPDGKIIDSSVKLD